MKKLFTFLTLLIVSGMISPALATTYYQLWVGGIQVTSDNASNITGSSISGTVSYDNSTKTLTLTSASITSTSNGINNKGIDGLTILINSSSSITSDYAGIYCEKTTTIKGLLYSSTLTIKGSATNCGIWAKNCDYLYIDHIWLNASGGYGLYGGDSDTTIPTLVVKCSNVYAYASKDGISCIQGFQQIITSGSIYDYSGYKYDTTKKQHLNSSGSITKSFYIRPRIAIGRYIWDVRDNATISKNTIGAGLTSGSFSYDSSTRTLTMDNVKMSTGYIPIRYYGPAGGGDLNIKVTGTNEITMTDGASVECIYAIGNGVTITGNGATSSKLTVNNQNGAGIYLYSYSGTKNLNIKDVTLNITSTTENAWSINGVGTTALTVEKSAITAAYGIKGITSCTLNASYVYNGGEYNETLKGFSSDGTNLTKGTVGIGVGYALTICGTRVTPSNQSDVLGDGTVSFSNNILYLKNFSKTYDYTCISNNIENLWIQVSGGATITSSKNHVIYSEKSFRLSSYDFSNVTLRSNAKNEGYCGIYMNGAGTVTIEKVWMSVYAPQPLYGTKSQKPELDLKLCQLYVSSTDNYDACVYGFNQLSTTGVIYNYTGNTYNTANTRIETSSGSKLYSCTFMPRLSVKKFIFDPRYSATIDKSIAGVTSGNITYSDYTLTLDNATIDAGSWRGIQYYGPTGGHDLTIKVKGTSTINSQTNTSSACIHSNNNNVTISGDGNASSKLTINNHAYNYGISWEGDKTLTIKDIRLDVTGTEKRSIYSYGSGQLNVSKSNVYASYGISGFADCTLEDCYFSSPSYQTTYSTSLKGVTSDGSKVYDGYVAISQGYRLYIAGTQVTTANAANITGTGISGTVSYNSATKTLTLKDANIKASGVGITNYNIDGLKILVDGTGTVESTGGYGIYADKSTTIISNDFSSLYVYGATNYNGIRMENGSKLRVETVWLYVEAGYAIQGNKDNDLELAKCYLSAKSTTSGNSCLYGFKDIASYGVTYDYDGTTFTNGRLEKSGKVVDNHVVMPRISVGKYIWDPRSNATINSSSPGAGITAGSMTYTIADHKLTLNGVTMNPGAFTAIRFYGFYGSNDGLTVAVKGSNNISYASYMGANSIHCYDRPLNITGDGKASSTLNVYNTAGSGIYIYNKALNISNVTLNVSGTGSALSMVGNGDATLNINNSEVTASKQIYGFTALNMQGCAIAEPEGAYYSASLKGITTNGSSVYEGKVVIKDVNYGLYIGETEVKSSNAADVLGNGQFSYDPGTKTLTVKNAKLENAGSLGTGIDNRSIDGLKINVVGDNSITSRDYTLGARKPFSIIGSGSLTLNTENGIGIYFASGCTDCTIDGPNITVNAGQTAIYDAANGTSLTLKNPSTRIVLNPAKGFVTVSNLKAMQFFDDLRVIRPAGTFMSSALKGLTQDGTSLLKRKVTIASNDPADVNKDRIVDVADIGAVISVMSGTDKTHAATADVNGDTTVDVADIAAVVTAMSEMSRQQKADMEE